MTKIIDGKKISQEILKNVEKNISILKDKKICTKIATILVGYNEASKIYVNAKIKTAEKIGIDTELLHMKSNITKSQLSEEIVRLNMRDDVTGILLQLPLPKHIGNDIAYNAIKNTKDIDGFGVYNMGMLNYGKNAVFPCTPYGIMFLLKRYLGNLSGKKAVIIGRSFIVGRPIATMLLNEDCTISVIHSKTVNPKIEASTADIIIAAAGVPNLVKEDWVKKNAFIIDVGINRIGKKIVGDVDINSVIDKVSYITPVPGGVGPMTIASLMLNALRLNCLKHNIKL